MKVELTLQTDAGEVRIKRSSAPVQMWIDGEPVKGGAKVVEEKLKSVLGVTPEILSLLTYRGQRQPGLFLSKTDSEKKELLTQLLDLGRFEKAIETGQQKVKELEQALAIAQAQVETARAMVNDATGGADLASLKEQLTSAETELVLKKGLKERALKMVETRTKDRDAAAQVVFASYVAGIQETEAAIKALPAPTADFDDTELQKLKATLVAIKTRSTALQERDSQAHHQRNEKEKELTVKIADCQKTLALRPQLLAKEKQLKNELKTLDQGVCPTCEREWEETEAKRTEIFESLSSISGNLAFCAAHESLEIEVRAERDALPPFEPDPMLAKLQGVREITLGKIATEEVCQQAAYAHARAEHLQAMAVETSKLTALKEEQRNAVQAIKDAAQPDIEKAGVVVERMSAAIQDMALTVSHLKGELRMAEEAINRRMVAETKLDQLTTQLLRTQTLLNEEKDLLLVLGREGFLGSIFDEVLGEISDETNKILGSVANTRHCTLHFRSESTTQKGTIKKAIVPVVTINGNEAPLQGGPSGGMLSTIELAVDLALGAVLSRRQGVCPGWLVLDECFDGLDDVSKESCLEILSSYASDRLVLVVDHSEGFKSMFVRTLRVECSDGSSRFV